VRVEPLLEPSEQRGHRYKVERRADPGDAELESILRNSLMGCLHKTRILCRTTKI
jgi:hypothetical protein